MGEPTTQECAGESTDHDSYNVTYSKSKGRTGDRAGHGRTYRSADDRPLDDSLSLLELTFVM